MRKPAPGGAPPGTADGQRVGQMVREALRQAERSAEELAAAIQVPPEYVHDLMAGRRRPPLPGRTDLYDRMASFLRVGRHALETGALAERGAAGTAAPGSSSEVSAALLGLCETETAREIRRRARRDGGAQLAGLTRRLLDVVQGMVRRMLDDQVGLRLAAAQRGVDYVELRFRLLEFLDGTPDTLTLADVADHVAPRIARWDADLDADVLRVVLRTHEPQNRGRRRPNVRHGFQPRD